MQTASARLFLQSNVACRQQRRSEESEEARYLSVDFGQPARMTWHSNGVRYTMRPVSAQCTQENLAGP